MNRNYNIKINIGFLLIRIILINKYRFIENYRNV